MDKGGAGAESKINNIGSAILEKGFVVAIKKTRHISHRTGSGSSWAPRALGSGMKR